MRRIKSSKNRRILFLCIKFFIISFIMSFSICFLMTPKIEITSRKVVFSLGEDVELPKYVAYFHNKEITSEVEVKGEVDNEKIGSYLIEYQLNSFLFPVKELVLVEIVDQEKPSIELVGGNQIYLCPNKEYHELGYRAVDNYDGDLTDNVVVSNQDNQFIYRVQDSSGNGIEVTRTVFYEDKEVPILELKGNQRLVLYVGSMYQELGYNVSDNCDSEIASRVKIVGKVDTNKVGTYLIHYEVTDSSGNFTSKTRTVEVIARPVVESYSPQGNELGEIYLTFDDGPSRTITAKVLDILKEEGVKATFFVIHHDSSLHSLIKREHQEGHTVALHSYTHNYSKIYSSTSAYFEDLKKIEDEVKGITGVDSKIIRFPGGSSNTVSKNYKRGIMSELSNMVLNKGYHYFDWNVSSGDAGGVRSSEAVYRNVISGLSKNRINVVLMHDFENNYYTLNALRDIIHYGKQNGYVFKNITMDTAMVRHKVVN